jgi:hypothetical protein
MIIGKDSVVEACYELQRFGQSEYGMSVECCFKIMILSGRILFLL